MTMDDCHQSFKKEIFIARLPFVFVEKVRLKLDEQNNNTIPFDKLTYEDLINTINLEGLSLCNDLKMK